MEDNAPAHVHHYHDIPGEKFGFTKVVWPTSSPDLNPIETIWPEFKDILREKIGPRMNARQIRLVLEEVTTCLIYFFYFHFLYLQ